MEAQPPPESKFPELASDAKAEIAADWSKVCLCCNSSGVVVGWVDGSKHDVYIYIYKWQQAILICSAVASAM